MADNVYVVKNPTAQTTQTEAAPAAATGTAANQETLEDLLKKREKETQGTINTAYDSGLNAQKQGLLDSYNQNVRAQAQQRETAENAFQTAQNDVAVQNDRNAANLTRFADVRDVNTGLGSQHRLNLGNARANAEATMEFQRQQALAESERQKALMDTTYQNQVSAALADNDYKRAAALLDDYNNQNTWREQQAEILATYGDFSGYAPLYGDEAAANMQAVWNAQNPEIAFRTGQIDGETYKLITGVYPEGYTPGGGGWYGGYGGWGGPGGPKKKNGGNLTIGGSSGPSAKSTSTHTTSSGPSGHSTSSNSSTSRGGNIGVPAVSGAVKGAMSALSGITLKR